MVNILQLYITILRDAIVFAKWHRPYIYAKTGGLISINLPTEGPPLTRFLLQRIHLPLFLSYVRASGGFSH